MERMTFSCSIPGHCTRKIMVVTPRRSRHRAISDDETVARELAEALVEALAGRERLVLLPAAVRAILRPQERRRLRERGRRVGGHVAFFDQRRLDRGRPPELETRRAEELELALERRHGRVGIHQPRVAQARRAPDASVAVGRHPDRRARALHRTHRDPRRPQLEVAALVVDRLAAPQPLDDLEALDEAADAILRILPERLIFDVAIAEADTEDQPAVGDDVERGELLGDLDGVVQGKQQDAGAEDHAARLGGDPRQRRDRLEVRERIGQVVLARPYRAEAHGTREAYLLDVLAEANGLRLLRQVLDGEAEAELHSGSLQTRPAGGSSVTMN